MLCLTTIFEEQEIKPMSQELKTEIRKDSTREKMDDSSFLLPEKKKFPVKNPKTGNYDCSLIRAAFIRANQWKSKKPEYAQVAAKADALLKKYCGKSE